MTPSVRPSITVSINSIPVEEKKSCWSRIFCCCRPKPKKMAVIKQYGMVERIMAVSNTLQVPSSQSPNRRSSMEIITIKQAIKEENKLEKDDKIGFLSIKEFYKKHKSIKEGSIRKYMLENKNNFNEKVFSRIGNRIYIRESSFFDWMKENNL